MKVWRVGAVAVVGAMGLAAGCSSAPGWEGSWSTVEVPGTMPDGSEGTLVITEGGTYTVTFRDGSGRTFYGQSGTWEEDGGSIMAMTRDEDGLEATAVIDGDGRLVATSEGESVVFERKDE